MLYRNKDGTVERLSKLIETIDDYSLAYIKEALMIYQHEREVHLIVTAFVGIIAFILLVSVVFAPELVLLLLFVIFVVLESFYLLHYYLLENNVQKLELLYLKRLCVESNDSQR